MKFVLVDTSVWSLALRKKSYSESETKLVEYLAEMVLNFRVVMIGAIRQEILSGISDINAFSNLREKISAILDFEVTTDDYERAAEFSNICRSHGIQGSHTDFLIASVAAKNGFDILTLDNDFNLYKQYIPINTIAESEWL